MESSETLESQINRSEYKILIVDDVFLNIKVAIKLLEKYGANCIDSCSSGAECIDKIRRGGKYDLLFLDDMMPKMSGVETFHYLKALPDFNVPTIALTANAISGMREKYLEDGFYDVSDAITVRERTAKIISDENPELTAIEVYIKLIEEKRQAGE